MTIETRGQSERSVEGSANDVVPSTLKEVVNFAVSESRNIEIVVGVIDSVIQ